MKTNILLIIALSVLLAPTWAAERADESVLLIDMHYSKGNGRQNHSLYYPAAVPVRLRTLLSSVACSRLKSKEGRFCSAIIWQSAPHPNRGSEARAAVTDRNAIHPGNSVAQQGA